jgi:hypothetical protein
VEDSNSGLPFCDESLTIAERVKDLISRVPDDEKLGGTGKKSLEALESLSIH